MQIICLYAQKALVLNLIAKLNCFLFHTNKKKIVLCFIQLSVGISKRGQFFTVIPAGNYMFKVDKRNTRTRCEICLKLTVKIPERRQWPILVFFFVKHLSRLLSKHFCLQPYFSKDSVSLLVA